MNIPSMLVVTLVIGFGLGYATRAYMSYRRRHRRVALPGSNLG